MLDAYICSGVRSPFGRHAGMLANIRPDDLLGEVIKKLIADSRLKKHSIDDVIIGCGNQAGEDSRCVARHALLRAELPIEIPGMVVQRNCASGLGAVIAGSYAISCGEANIIISGGVESMTRAPFVVAKAEMPFSKHFSSFDSAIGARFPNPKIEQIYGSDTMPKTADNLAKKFQLKREDCDVFAFQSQKNYKKAKDNNFFNREIMGVLVPGCNHHGHVIVSEDEFPRPNTQIEVLGKLRPIYPRGVTTAGNSSGINDGAVALVMCSKDQIGKFEHPLLCRVLATGVAGVEPKMMGFGPVPATEKALKRAELALKDMDVIEINEAFAAQVLACLKGMQLDSNDSRVNPNGGAISIGHPLGASGTRLVLTAARQLYEIGGRYALVSMCVGMGQGVALVMERINI